MWARFAYNLDRVVKSDGKLAAALAGRERRRPVRRRLLSRSWWSGEIFTIVDDIRRLPPGFDSPLHKGCSV